MSNGIIWVTGGRGALGRYVGRELATHGWTAASIGRGEWQDAAEWGFELHIARPVDVRALESLRERTGIPTALFHAAGSGTVQASFEDPLGAFYDTVATAQECLEFMRAHAPAAPFIYPSSAAVYGAVGIEHQPIEEDRRLSPTSPYGSYKVVVEELCRSAARDFGIGCRLIRFFSLYGPEMRKQVVWDIARKATSCSGPVELAGTGEETRDFLHLEDAATLVRLTIEDALRTDDVGCVTLNGGTGQGTSISNLARIVLEAFPGEREATFSGTERQGDPSHYRAATARTDSLGFSPQWTLGRGIQDFYEWFMTEDLDDHSPVHQPMGPA